LNQEFIYFIFMRGQRYKLEMLFRAGL